MISPYRLPPLLLPGLNDDFPSPRRPSTAKSGEVDKNIALCYCGPQRGGDGCSVHDVLERADMYYCRCVLDWRLVYSRRRMPITFTATSSECDSGDTETAAVGGGGGGSRSRSLRVAARAAQDYCSGDRRRRPPAPRAPPIMARFAPPCLFAGVCGRRARQRGRGRKARRRGRPEPPGQLPTLRGDN